MIQYVDFENWKKINNMPLGYRVAKRLDIIGGDDKFYFGDPNFYIDFAKDKLKYADENRLNQLDFINERKAMLRDDVRNEDYEGQKVLRRVIKNAQTRVWRLERKISELRKEIEQMEAVKAAISVIKPIQEVN